MPVAEILRLEGVRKTFGGVVALKEVSMAIAPGEVWHLLGENGSGKSTLIKIISGVLAPDAGRIWLGGQEFAALDPYTSMRLGVATTFQDLSLFPNLSVLENVTLGYELLRQQSRLLRRVDWRQVTPLATRALERVGARTDRAFLNTPVGALSFAERQLVAIARALIQDAKLVILDEPTAALSQGEIERLVRVVKGLQAEQLSVMFVTHKLEEAYDIGGRVFILRDGVKVAEGDISDFDKAELGYLMTGQRVGGRIRSDSAKPSDETAPALSLEGVSHPGGLFQDINLEVRPGEILGITGPLGAGQQDLCRALFGLEAYTGVVRLNGRPVSLRTPEEAVSLGIVYLPEDRAHEGLFPERSVEENIASTSVTGYATPLGLVVWARIRELVDGYIRSLRVKTPHRETPVRALSGGNQQKVLLGRGLAAKPVVLILDNPTAGVDVGSKFEIHRIINSLAEEGMAVLVTSNDLPELASICDRVIVMQDGKIAGILPATELETGIKAIAGKQTGTEG